MNWKRWDTKIQVLNNGAGIRIPKVFMDQMQLRIGDEVTVTIVRGGESE